MKKKIVFGCIFTVIILTLLSLTNFIGYETDFFTLLKPHRYLV
jgi:hypothetical protein